MPTSISDILCVAGARPNFVKIAPIMAELGRRKHLSARLVHTGQHYDAQMSDAFFRDLAIPEPDVHLGVGSSSHAEQTARVMMAFEEVLLNAPPAVVVVVGDVNSTLACSLAAAKLHVPVAHVESGLRSGDRTMPEEVNRILTDQLSDLLLTTSRDANVNLGKEGIPAERIHLVGNVMIDSLRRLRAHAESQAPWECHGLSPGNYGFVTLHRPSNVDERETFERLMRTLIAVSEQLPLLFPLHPRTAAKLDEFGLHCLIDTCEHLTCTKPLGYLECLGLMSHARLVLSDSGGVQEETTALGVPCLTLRENTERPVTCEEGTNTLIGTDSDAILREVTSILANGGKAGRCPELWDGHAAERVVNALEEFLARRRC